MREEVVDTTARSYVTPGLGAAKPRAELTQAEQSILAGGQALAGNIMAHDAARNITYARQDDTAESIAKAHLTASIPLIALSIVTNGALFGLMYSMLGQEMTMHGLSWFLCAIVSTGITSYIAVTHARSQGLYHSATGIEHHRLDVEEYRSELQAETAQYAINVAADTILNLRKEDRHANSGTALQERTAAHRQIATRKPAIAPADKDE